MTIDIQTVAGVLGNVLEWYDFALYGKNIIRFTEQFCTQITLNVVFVANY